MCILAPNTILFKLCHLDYIQNVLQKWKYKFANDTNYLILLVLIMLFKFASLRVIIIAKLLQFRELEGTKSMLPNIKI